jgi:hypothetical protein
VNPAGRRSIGLATIALALGFNVPYAMLAATFEYPQILRRPAGEALEAFALGGDALVLTWHAFALCAFALVPLAPAIALTRQRLLDAPVLALIAGIAGSLAGLAQAIGLWRWVFVVPGLALAHSAPDATDEARLAAERAFVLLNQYGGVAIGEHVGQLLVALFVAATATLQWRELSRATAVVGFVSAVAIGLGTGEGLALALQSEAGPFSLATMAGFVGLTAWLLLTGAGALRSPAPASSRG